MTNKLLLASAAAVALALSACGDSQPADQTATPTAETEVLPPAETTTETADATTTETAAAGAAGAAASTAAGFVQTAAISDMYEIQSSKLALEKAQNQAVKDFAQQMISAHEQTTAQLKTTLNNAGVDVTPPTEVDAAHQALLQELSAASGDAFDQRYIEQQTQAHEQALALMQSYSTGGDNPQLQQFASETAPKIRQHLEDLRKIKAS